MSDQGQDPELQHVFDQDAAQVCVSACACRDFDHACHPPPHCTRLQDYGTVRLPLQAKIYSMSDTSAQHGESDCLHGKGAGLYTAGCRLAAEFSRLLSNARHTRQPGAQHPTSHPVARCDPAQCGVPAGEERHHPGHPRAADAVHQVERRGLAANTSSRAAAVQLQRGASRWDRSLATRPPSALQKQAPHSTSLVCHTSDLPFPQSNPICLLPPSGSRPALPPARLQLAFASLPATAAHGRVNTKIPCNSKLRARLSPALQLRQPQPIEVIYSRLSVQ